jgi:hypothetical protein
MAATADPPTGPPVVSRFEYNLLRLLRFALGHMPAEQAAPLVLARLAPAPGCLSRACVRLAEDTLAKGVVLHLVRAGGWRRERFLRAGKPTDGRVWDRVPLTDRALEFSRHPLAFLRWLTAEKPTDTKEPWDVSPTELTPADEVFFALAYDNLRAMPDVAGLLAGKTAFRRNCLCWLQSPGDFGTTDEPTPPAFGPWVTGQRAVVLECLQPALAERWTRSERAKGQINDWRTMRTQGHAEQAVLAGFLAVAETAGRPDLARFVLKAAEAILRSPDLGPEFWTGGLRENRPQRLADRLATERVALALPRQLDVLQRWDRKARSVGFFDEDYAASQLWKADWEAARGDELAARAKAVLDKLEPLRAG